MVDAQAFSGAYSVSKAGVLKTDPPRAVPERGIALCLSGGGYRAMLFHVGALRPRGEVAVQGAGIGAVRALRKHRGVTEDAAFDMVIDPSYFGTLMVAAGEVDDAEPPVTQAHARPEVGAVGVRPAMAQDIRHATEELPVHGVARVGEGEAG